MLTVKQSRRVRNEGNERDAIPSTTVSSRIPETQGIWLRNNNNIFMPPPLGTGGIMFSGCPSVHPSEAWNIFFPPVHWSVGPSDQFWPFCDMSVRLSVRLERCPGICRRKHGGNDLKLCMLMYIDHLPNWLVYGHGLLIFWLSETGQIWGFRAFPGERMEVIDWHFACWFISTTSRTIYFMVTVCWFSNIGANLT